MPNLDTGNTGFMLPTWRRIPNRVNEPVETYICCGRFELLGDCDYLSSCFSLGISEVGAR